MNTSYRRADSTDDYVCTRARTDAVTTPGCGSIATAAVNPALELVLAAVDGVHAQH
ncbi:hypothetical protein [Streptomyces sp. NPDC002088]|uniref:hypothetical protein n=1 Tax=Streptomyces sp. NPDC002088 TaxID=3154665 RepID=UPI003326FE7B